MHHVKFGSEVVCRSIRRASAGVAAVLQPPGHCCYRRRSCCQVPRHVQLLLRIFSRLRRRTPHVLDHFFARPRPWPTTSSTAGSPATTSSTAVSSTTGPTSSGCAPGSTGRERERLDRNISLPLPNSALPISSMPYPAGSAARGAVVDCSAPIVGLTMLVAPFRTRSNPAFAVVRTVPIVAEPRLKAATAGAMARARTAADDSLHDGVAGGIAELCGQRAQTR